jgi:hypothetical protein
MNPDDFPYQRSFASGIWGTVSMAGDPNLPADFWCLISTEAAMQHQMSSSGVELISSVWDANKGEVIYNFRAPVVVSQVSVTLTIGPADPYGPRQFQHEGVTGRIEKVQWL